MNKVICSSFLKTYRFLTVMLSALFSDLLFFPLFKGYFEGNKLYRSVKLTKIIT